MDNYSLRISPEKRLNILYSGFSIDNCYVFYFECGGLYYLPEDRVKQYIETDKIRSNGNI